jgi:hypothetical protein
MRTAEKVEILLAFGIYQGAKWFLRILVFMFTAICVHLFIRWAGLNLPPYF